jgi:hypothetical protein
MHPWQQVSAIRQKMRRASSLGTRALPWAFVVVVISATPLRAVASALSIEWSAPQECPDRKQVAARVGRLVGEAVGSQLSVSTQVTRTERAYRASVRISGPAGVGERNLENAECDLLAESVALVIALSATSADTPVPDRRSAPTARPSFGFSAQASALFGVLPNPALGLGAGLSMDTSPALRFELRGSYYAEQSATFDQSSLGGRFNLVTFAARGCYAWRLGAFDLAPCIGADLYHVTASGFGGEESLSPNATSWGPALGLFGRWRLHEAFAIYIAADAVVPLTRRRFVFADVGELHRGTVVAAQLLLAPEMRF